MAKRASSVPGEAVEGGVFVEVGGHAVELVVVGGIGEEDFGGGDADYGA